MVLAVEAATVTILQGYRTVATEPRGITISTVIAVVAHLFEGQLRRQRVCGGPLGLRPNTDCSEQQLIDFCSGQIASFKVPRYIRFVKEWPISSTKIQKSKLSETLITELALDKPDLS